jgi:hypothetical protein
VDNVVVVQIHDGRENLPEEAMRHAFIQRTCLQHIEQLASGNTDKQKCAGIRRGE